MNSNLPRLQFYRKWLGLTFSKPFGLATKISGGIGILAGVVTYFYPILSGQMNILIWGLPAVFFLLFFILGFFNAPFLMYQELNSARLKEIKARDESIKAYEERLRKTEEVTEPLEIEGFQSSLLEKIKSHYEAEDRVVAYPRLSQKDEYLEKGFDLAYQPGTNREVWIGTGSRSDRNIMMLKPKAG